MLNSSALHLIVHSVSVMRFVLQALLWCVTFHIYNTRIKYNTDATVVQLHYEHDMGTLY